MIIGFVNGDSRIVGEVNRKALGAVAMMIVLLGLIAAMAVLLVKLGGWLVSLL